MLLPRKAPGYLSPPVIIVLALIVLFVAMAFYLNAKLFSKPITGPNPTPIAQSSPSPSSNSSKTDETANWETYSDTKNGFTLKHAPDWTPTGPNSKEDPSVLWLKKTTGSAINVIVFPTQSKNLQEYLGSTKDKEGDSVYKAVENRRIKVDSEEAEFIIQEIPGREEGRVSVSTVHEGKSYQIISVYKDDKAILLREFNQILSTFQFLN